MLKIIFSRWLRLLLTAIAALGLLMGTVACSNVTPDDLPQLDSINNRLPDPSMTDAPAADSSTVPTLTDPPSVDEIEATPAEFSRAAETAAETVDTPGETVRQLPEVVEDPIETPHELQESLTTQSSKIQEQLKNEQATIQATLEEVNAEAAEALEAELDRAEAVFDKELDKMKSRLQPFLDKAADPSPEETTNSAQLLVGENNRDSSISLDTARGSAVARE